jgi:hypothetical protein
VERAVAAREPAQESTAATRGTVDQTASTCGYEQRVGQEFSVGNDLWDRVGSVEDCKTACDARVDCLGFSRLTGEDRTCWFKGYEDSDWMDAKSNVVGYQKRATCSSDATASSAVDPLQAASSTAGDPATEEAAVLAEAPLRVADLAEEADSVKAPEDADSAKAPEEPETEAEEEEPVALYANEADVSKNLTAVPSGYQRMINRNQFNARYITKDKKNVQTGYDGSLNNMPQTDLSTCFSACTKLSLCKSLTIRSEVTGEGTSASPYSRTGKYLCSYYADAIDAGNSVPWPENQGGKFRDVYTKI